MGAGFLTDGVGPYPSMANCSWLITPTPHPQWMTLTFSEVSIENEFDMLRVYET